MMHIQSVPQVHTDTGSDPYFWKQVFPRMYKHRTYTLMDWLQDGSGKPLIADGDIKFERTKSGKHIPRCLGCNKLIKDLKPRLFGNSHVGIELIYECPNCEAKSRIYSQERRF